MKRNIFKLFANCIVTKGYSRALIADSQRGNYYTVPLGMCTYILDHEMATVDEIITKFASDHSSRLILDEYFSFLFEHELIFECHEAVAQNFPATGKEFSYPATITNAIIDLKIPDTILLSEILKQLISLQCFALSINIKEELTEIQFHKILNVCQTAEIDDLALSVIARFNINIKDIKTKFPFLSSLEFIHATINEEYYDDTWDLKITKSKCNIQELKYCGVIAEKYFNLSSLHYTESLHHNTCLNRKIAIDIDGNIKNCPSMPESFGNIKDTTLQDALDKPGFKKYWNIKKDEIAKCKDCEFRHVCTDCRAYLENPDDIYSAPLKCGYDPYTCTWEDWSINPLKQKAIGYYKMNF